MVVDGVAARGSVAVVLCRVLVNVGKLCIMGVMLVHCDYGYNIT